MYSLYSKTATELCDKGKRETFSSGGMSDYEQTKASLRNLTSVFSQTNCLSKHSRAKSNRLLSENTSYPSVASLCSVRTQFTNLSSTQRTELAQDKRKKNLANKIRLNKIAIKKKEEEIKERKIQLKIQGKLQKEGAKKVSEMRKLKLKLHNVIKDKRKICTEADIKDYFFNRKLIDFFTRDYYINKQLNYHSVMRFSEDDSVDRKKKLFLIDLDKAKNERFLVNPSLDSYFTPKEVEIISSDPSYFFQNNFEYIRSTDNFHHITLTDRLISEEEKKKKKKQDKKKKLHLSPIVKLQRVKSEPKTEYEEKYEQSQKELKELLKEAHKANMIKKIYEEKHSLKKLVEKELNRMVDRLNNVSKMKKSEIVSIKKRTLPTKEKRSSIIRNNYERIKMDSWLTEQIFKGTIKRDPPLFPMDCQKGHSHKNIESDERKIINNFTRNTKNSY